MRPMPKPLYRCVCFGLRVFFRCVFRLRIIRLAETPPDSAAVIASNHQSYLDPFLGGCFAPGLSSFMARDTLFKSLQGSFITFCHAFAVKRDTADAKALRTGVDRIKGGENLFLFPEGTRTRDGKPQSVKPGFSLILRKAKAPLLPVYIHGADKAWPRGKKMIRPFSELTVVYGAPIYPHQLPADRKEHAKAVQQAIENFWHEQYQKLSTSES
jgi:1-acyl-sn-glycerol-3-phosphate acyltransferase